MNLNRRQLLRTWLSLATQGWWGLANTTRMLLSETKVASTFLPSMQRVLQLQSSVKGISHLVLWGIYGKWHDDMPDPVGITKEELGTMGFTKEALTKKYGELANTLLTIQKEHPDRINEAFHLLEPFSRSHLFDATFRGATTHQQRIGIIRWLISRDSWVSSELFLDLQVADEHYPGTYLAKWLNTVDASTFNLFVSTYKDMSKDFMSFRWFIDDFFFLEDFTGISNIETVRRWSTIFELSDDNRKMVIIKELAQIFFYAPNILTRLVHVGIENPFIKLIQETSKQFWVYKDSVVYLEWWDRMIEGSKFWDIERQSILQRFWQLQSLAKVIRDWAKASRLIEWELSEAPELDQLPWEDIQDIALDKPEGSSAI